MMQEKQLFEYAILRVVPQVEREEFLNVGVVLYCSSKKYLDTLFEVNRIRLLATFPAADVEELEARLNAFKRISAGGKDAGKIARLPIASRFRWLTAARSTVVQTSKVHPGFCDDPAITISRLFEQLVKQE